jgi:glycosyltransferase involved in cell wall biosynthesis/GT2 family glycosyltransferase
MNLTFYAVFLKELLLRIFNLLVRFTRLIINRLLTPNSNKNTQPIFFGRSPLIFRILSIYQEVYQAAYQAAYQEINKRKINHNPKRLKKDSPIVSVVIPCFNYGSFVEEAICSVLTQTISNFEIIVIDGGSDDASTIKILKKLQKNNLDSRIKFYFRSERHLVGNNRNFGIQKARGRYICCLDADDTISPTYLEKAIFLLETYGHDISSSPIYTLEKVRKKFNILTNPTLEDQIYRNHISTCAVFKRSIWVRVGGFKDFGSGKDYIYEDWEFWVRALSSGASVRNLDQDFLFNYRIHNAYQSLSNVKGVRSFERHSEFIRGINRNLLTRENFLISKNAFKFLNYSNPSKTALALDGNLQNKGSNKKNILIVLPFFLVGGVERLLSNFCIYLQKKGWHIILISTLNQDEAFGNSIPWFEKTTAELYQLPLYLKPLEYDDFIDYLIASRKVKIVLNAGSQVLYDALPNIKKKYKNIKAIDYLFNTVGHVSSHLKYKKAFDAIFCENNEVSLWAENIAGWKKPDIYKIASGIDLNFYKPKQKNNELLSQLNIKKTDFVVGFFGRLSEEKGPDIFMKIAKVILEDNHKDINFIMTGSGPMKKLIIKEAKSLNKFNYLGLVKSTADFVSICDVVILPSRNDGRPLIVLESLALGVPVIANNVGGLKELIKHDLNGFLVEGNRISGFVGYIASLLNNKRLLLQRKKNARTFALRNLDANKSNIVFENALEKFIH